MTTRQEQWYRSALAAYANGSGDRYNTQAGKLTWCAANLGLSADAVLSDLSGLMEVTPKDCDNIRRGIHSASAKVGLRESRTYTTKQSGTKRIGLPFIVPDYIKAGGAEATSEAIRARSPVNLTEIRNNPAAQTAAFLATLYSEKELLFVKAQKSERGTPGRNILPRAAWNAQNLVGRDCLYRNPLTGNAGLTTGGDYSFTAASCIATPRYALIEFDELPIRQQAAFWLGFLSLSQLAPRLVSLVWSGGKSIHGLLRMNADSVTAPTWERHLRDYFASNPDRRYCADPCGFRPHGGTRLAGAIRSDNHATQQLLFLANPQS